MKLKLHCIRTSTQIAAAVEVRVDRRVATAIAQAAVSIGLALAGIA